MTCPHCGIAFTVVEAVGGVPREPKEESTGVCASCWQWWELKGGQLVKHRPTLEETVLIALDMMKRRRGGANN